MTSLFGLQIISSEAMPVFLTLFVFGAVAIGWITDAIMGRMGYGVVGNSVLTMMGVLLALFLWARFIGQIRPRDVSLVAAAATAGVMSVLLLVALFKRALR